MSHGSTSISSWLLRVVLVVGVFGVVANDAVATFSASVSIVDDANAAARAGRVALSNGGNWAALSGAVDDYANSHHESVVPGSLAVANDGTVTVKLIRRARTIVIGRIPWLKDLAQASAQGAAGAGP